MANASSVNRRVRFILEEENGKDKCRDLGNGKKETKEAENNATTIKEERETQDKGLRKNNNKAVENEKKLKSREFESVKLDTKQDLSSDEKTLRSEGCDDDDENEESAQKKILATEEKNKDLKDSYEKACRKYGATPSSRFMHQSTTSVVVDMKHYGLGDKGARAIAMTMRENNQNLECLNLHDNGIGDVGVKSVCDMMASNSSLTKLDLSGNRVGKPGVSALSEMLQSNVYLKDLNLSGCAIKSGSDVEKFISSLVVNNQLESLNLSNNEIGDGGAICLGPVLLSNQSLRFLDVSWNNIHSAGAEALCRGLSRNVTLTELDISWNGLGNNGAEFIKQSLLENKSLRILNLCCNHISLDGVKQIVKALTRSRTLEVLRIGKNPFLSSGASMILKSLLANQHSALFELSLDGVVFNEECEARLSALLEQNPMFLCTWDVTIKGGSVVSSKQPEPMELLLICIHNQGFRLIDFYRILTNDYKGLLLKKEEFVTGVKKRSFPFSEKQLRAMFDVLDTKKSGSITFEQFLVLKNYKRQKRRR